jgi:transposase
MKDTNSPTGYDWIEGRRLRAWELAQSGWKQKDIAVALGVSKGAVSQWLKRGREGGRAALHRQPAPGAVSRLSREQLHRLPELLARGAEAYGFRGNVWTHKRIVAVIHDTFGVKYHAHHIRRILDKIGWSRQKPRRQASQRNTEGITAWREQDWPQAEKKR